MYGITPILQSDLYAQIVPTDIGVIEQETFSLFPYYIWFMAFILVVYLLWTIFISTFIKLFQRCCAKAAKYAEQNIAIENDLLTTISYRQLKAELRSTTNDIRKARLMQELFENEEKETVTMYIERLQVRKEAIMSRIEKFYATIFNIKELESISEKQEEDDEVAN